MSDSVPKNGTAARQLWVSIALLVFALSGGAFGAIWWIGSVASDVKTNMEAHTALEARVADLTRDVRELQISMTKLQSQQIETETQFCSSDIVRNLMHANDMRTVSLLWEKEFGVKFPTDNAYYPTICRRDVMQQ